MNQPFDGPPAHPREPTSMSAPPERTARPYPTFPPPAAMPGGPGSIPLPAAPATAPAYIAIAGLVAAAATSALYAWHSWTLGRTIDRVERGEIVPDSRFAQLDQRAGVITVLILLAMLVAAIATITWLYKSRAIAETYGPFDFRRTRGWTIGGWFCPIVNLWFPYQCVADVVLASRTEVVPGSSSKGRPQPVSVAIWWFAFLAAYVFNYVSGTTYDAADTLAEMKSTLIWDYAGTAADFIAVGCLIVIIAGVIKNQQLRFEQSQQMLAATYRWSG